MINRLFSLTAIAALFHAAGAFQVSNMNIRRVNSNLKSTVLEDITSSTEQTVGGSSLPPLLQDMANERREFEMNLGKAMDTLRKDYPTMLRKAPGTHSNR